MSDKKSKQFYLGNKNLPSPDAQFDYASNPDWVKDIEKCKENILYFAENFFFIANLDRGKEKIALYNYQKKILRSLRDSRFVVLLASRQIGKSTLLTIYALWIACFNEDQNILIVANKESTAINIFKRVRLAYEQLPNYFNLRRFNIRGVMTLTNFLRLSGRFFLRTGPMQRHLTCWIS